MDKTKRKQCKGLVIQNNPFSYNTGNGKTVASMLSKWDSENLAQIYVSQLPPDFSICENYFQMTDKEAVRSFITKKEFGDEMKKSEDAIREFESQMKEPEARMEGFRSGRKDSGSYGTQVSRKKNDLLKKVNGWASESPFAAQARDLVWRKSNWKNERLCKWLDQVEPEFVYLIAGNISVFYDMALFICERYGIPLFVHIGDDYFIYRRGLNPWKNLHRKRMSDKLGKAIARSGCVFAISDKLAKVFRDRYGGRYFVCMNSVELKEGCGIGERNAGHPVRLVYAGNLGIHRWKVLRLIGQALLELRREGICARLDVYSSYVPEKHILKKLSIPPVLRFCGSKFGDELEQVKKDADILVHVEAFEKRYRQLTYTAMSTKISEYLAEGKAILAVGPGEAASVGFLKKNRVAMVVTEYSKRAIKEQVREYLKDPGKIAAMRERAVRVARERFSKEKNARRVYKIISGG